MADLLKMGPTYPAPPLSWEGRGVLRWNEPPGDFVCCRRLDEKDVGRIRTSLPILRKFPLREEKTVLDQTIQKKEKRDVAAIQTFNPDYAYGGDDRSLLFPRLCMDHSPAQEQYV
jgi:hypothetical protein